MTSCLSCWSSASPPVGNQCWPAEYLIDPNGDVRHISFGAGGYSTTESLIRQLLTQSPLLNVSGSQPKHDTATRYAFPAKLTAHTFALSGTWTGHAEMLTAGADARPELSYQADDVYLVLGGTGTVTFGATTIRVAGPPKLYQLVHDPADRRAVLTLSATPGVQAYDFTFS